MTDQEQLDAGQKVLHKIIKHLDALVVQADTAADKACKAGDIDARNEIRAVSAELRIAAGHATSAYAKGGGLDMGGITARSGDK